MGRKPTRWLSPVFLAVLLLGLVVIGLPTRSSWAQSPDNVFDLGVKVYKTGQYDVARYYFTRAVRQDPGSALKHYYLADTLRKLRRSAEAEQEYQTVLTLVPGSDMARRSRVALVRLQNPSMVKNPVGASASTREGHAAIDRLTGYTPAGEDYMDVIASGGNYTRWSLKKMPLRLYVEDRPSGLRNYEPGFAAAAKKAVGVWQQATRGQIATTLVNQPQSADIVVRWVNTIDLSGYKTDRGTSYTAGLTTPKIRSQMLQQMDVQIATFDIENKPQSTEKIYAVAVHELGHALGLLGHSDNKTDIMFAQNLGVVTPSKRDLNTLFRLYNRNADVSNEKPDNKTKTADELAEQLERLEKSMAQQQALVDERPTNLNWINLSVTFFKKAQYLESHAGKLNLPNDDTAKPATWYQKTIDALNHALAQESQDSKAYYKRALAYRALRNNDAALADAQAAIRYTPGYGEAYLLKTWILMDQGQKGQAENTINEYLAIHPEGRNHPDIQKIQARLKAD
ncbi:MAG: tetratricopeptide repeat protein [Candidatus Melainabacteria bacterium]